MFKAENFDASKWVSLFKKAGIKYVMPVAEHHDGFAMYDTEFNRWNATKMGPCRYVVG
jgi:alpha-L-fucosidase